MRECMENMQKRINESEQENVRLAERLSKSQSKIRNLGKRLKRAKQHVEGKTVEGETMEESIANRESDVCQLESTVASLKERNADLANKFHKSNCLAEYYRGRTKKLSATLKESGKDVATDDELESLQQTIKDLQKELNEVNESLREWQEQPTDPAVDEIETFVNGAYTDAVF